MGRRAFHFVLPNVKKEIIGTQGEVARYIPYRLEEGLTPEAILEELRAQPHMAALADYMEPGRRIYLVEAENEELLQLAAEYIGCYHRLAEGTRGDVETDEDFDEEKDRWESGDTNEREFDFDANLPYLSEQDLSEVYNPDDGIGFGGRFYQGEHSATRPWWTLSPVSPVVVMTNGALNQIPPLVRAMERRERIILLYHKGHNRFPGHPMWSGMMRMEDLSFELETEMVRLEIPEDDSPYKRAILRQLAREKGAVLSSSLNMGKLMSLVRESRGDTDNATLSKVISNALLRRKTPGALVNRDFEYLSTIRSNGKKVQREERPMELVGQQNVRRQLERIVNNMAFQKKRREMGLPADEFHYTFAFLGAPGTGKTTWAMRLADEMKQRGLLNNTDCICINAAELKANYVGHTTGKVKALFEQYGVIILDEAYSLTEGENGDSFGTEALAQLCVELEKHGDDRLVVFAGYGGSSNREDNRMLRFLQSNPGINSRVSFKIHFENFRAEELTQVFRTMMAHSGYKVPEQADGLVTDFFRVRMAERAFGNCREVRNLADRVKIQVAARLGEQDSLTRETAEQVLAEDVRTAAAEILEEYRGLSRDGERAIGFGG